MEYVYVGKIVNTHALKGEVRLISDFEYKDRVFKIGNNLYIGHFKNKEELEIVYNLLRKEGSYEKIFRRKNRK